MQDAVAELTLYVYLALFLPLIYITLQGTKINNKANLKKFLGYFIPMLLFMLLLSSDKFMSEARLASVMSMPLMKYFLTDLGKIFMTISMLFVTIFFNAFFRNEDLENGWGIKIAHMVLAFGVAMGVWNLSFAIISFIIVALMNLIVLYLITIVASILIYTGIYIFLNRKKRMQVLNEPVVLKVLITIAIILFGTNLYLVKFMDLANHYSTSNILAFSAVIIVFIIGLIYAIPKLKDCRAFVAVGADLWNIEKEMASNPGALEMFKTKFIGCADNFKKSYPHLAGSAMLVPSF